MVYNDNRLENIRQNKNSSTDCSNKLHSEAYSSTPAAQNVNSSGAVNDPRQLDFSKDSDIYKSASPSRPTPEHPFSAADISNSGRAAASTLSSIASESQPTDGKGSARMMKDSAMTTTVSGNSGVFSTVDSQEKPQMVAQDINSLRTQSGAAGVDQYALGDCWFQSSVASLASSPEGQKSIANMITQNPDGSFKVTFPGDPKHPQTVTQKDLNNPNIQDSAQWAKILEAANLKRDPNTAKNGGDPDVALKLLTGKSATDISTKENINKLRSQLEQRLGSGQAIDVSGAPTTNSPLVGDHAYSVISAQNGEVTVRNPWGVQQPENKSEPAVGATVNGVRNDGGGELTMSTATFARYFTTVESSNIPEPKSKPAPHQSSEPSTHPEFTPWSNMLAGFTVEL